MKWSGQHIYDLISRFRNDVYLENISTGTIANGAHLGLDSNNKIVKAVDGGGDLTSIVAGTGLSGTSLTGPIPTLNVDASLTHVTSVGTIGTGTWQGTAIASAYLDADTAHLSGVQTFTGAKTFNEITSAVFDGNKTVTPGDGAVIHVDAHNVTDGGTAEGGTVAKYTHVNIEAPALLAEQESVTTTAAASLYISGSPTAGTNQTLTNQYALWVDAGLVKFDGALTVGGTITGDVTGDLTGQAATVATIAGLAPNTATTQATQPAIESIGTDGDTLAILADTLLMSNTSADTPVIKLVNTTDDDQAGQLIFEKLRDDDAVAQGQNVGEIWFKGQDAAQNTQNYAYIIGEIDVSTSGQESGQLLLSVANHDGGFGGAGLILTGGSEDVEIDVTVGLGANSVVTVPGDIDLAGDIDVDGTLETDALTIGGATIAAIGTTAITTLGTIGTGVWNGTKITDIYTNSSGKRYGSTIKILPSDFMINDDAASPLSFKDGSNSGIHVNDSSSEAIAFVTIPEGMKATLVDVYGTHAKTLKVWEVDVHESFDFTGSTIGTGAMNTQLDITDTNATATNYLAVQVTLTATSQRIWGGIVTIASQ